VSACRDETTRRTISRRRAAPKPFVIITDDSAGLADARREVAPMALSSGSPPALDGGLGAVWPGPPEEDTRTRGVLVVRPVQADDRRSASLDDPSASMTLVGDELPGPMYRPRKQPPRSRKGHRAAGQQPELGTCWCYLVAGGCNAVVPGGGSGRLPA
jgi:hypothetical protein